MISINLVSGEGGSRGFCFVDFETQNDLAKALMRRDSQLAGRPVSVRIAEPNNVSSQSKLSLVAILFKCLRIIH